MPAELEAVDRLLDDERFFAPYRRHFDPEIKPDTTTDTDDRPAGLGFWVNAMTVRDSRRMADPRPSIDDGHTIQQDQPGRYIGAIRAS